MKSRAGILVDLLKGQPFLTIRQIHEKFIDDAWSLESTRFALRSLVESGQAEMQIREGWVATRLPGARVRARVQHYRIIG